MQLETDLLAAPQPMREAAKRTSEGHLKKPAELLSYMAVKRGAAVRPPAAPLMAAHSMPQGPCSRDGSAEAGGTAAAEQEPSDAPSASNGACIGSHLPWYDELPGCVPTRLRSRAKRSVRPAGYELAVFTFTMRPE